MIRDGRVCRDARALRVCMVLWGQEHTDGFSLTDIPIEVIQRGAEDTQVYIDSYKASHEIIFRRKICLVGPACAGKTSLVKSITSGEPRLEHLDDRTIGIDHFLLQLKHRDLSSDTTKIHEVTFWDFAGQDAYQVAHSLFFSPRTLYLVCVDMHAFTVAYLQASIMATLHKQEKQLMDEFIDRAVMKWINTIITRQPDAEFVFIVTKEDLLAENRVTGQLLRTALATKLSDVQLKTREMRKKLKSAKTSAVKNESMACVGKDDSSVIFISCKSSASVLTATTCIKDVIIRSDRSFQMPDNYTKALEQIVAMRGDTKSITTRIDRAFVQVDTMPLMINLEPGICRPILRTLHDLGDVLWYEDLDIALFQDRVILDPLLLIDFIRQVINHKHRGQTMRHGDLMVLPYWSGLSDRQHIEAMKRVLQHFNLVYSAKKKRMMAWDSDLIVPAYWQTKTPAAWLFLGDNLRLGPTKFRDDLARVTRNDLVPTRPITLTDEAVRVHWEFHYEFGLPASLVDHFVVASVSPFITFDAGPDWVLYDEMETTACRLMVGRDRTRLHRTIHVEAVVAKSALEQHEKALWASFEHLIRAFVGVMREYPGLDVSSFAWGQNDEKIDLKYLAEWEPPSLSHTWMPPADTWNKIKKCLTH